MSFTHIQGLANSGTNVILATNPVTGNLVAGGVGLQISAGGSVSSVTVKDANNNAYVVIGTPARNTTSNLYAFGFYLPSAPANALKTITATVTLVSGTITYQDIFAEEFSPSSSASFDKSAISGTTAQSTPSIVVPSLTPTAAGELLYSVCIPLSSITAPLAGGTLGGWTGGATDSNGLQSEYILNSSSSLTTVNYTDSTNADDYASIVMAFNLTAAAFQPDEDVWRGPMPPPIDPNIILWQ